MLQDGAPPASCVGGDTAFSETATSGTAVYLRGNKKKKIEDAHVDDVCAAPPFPRSPPSAPLCSSATDAAMIRALTSSVPQNPAWVPFSTTDSTRHDPGTFKGQLVPQPKLTMPHRCSCSRPLQCRVPDLIELCTTSRGIQRLELFHFFCCCCK